MTYHQPQDAIRERRRGAIDRRQRSDRRAGGDRRAGKARSAGGLLLGWIAELSHGHLHLPRLHRRDRRRGERRTGLDRRAFDMRSCLSPEEIAFLLHGA